MPLRSDVLRLRGDVPRLVVGWVRAAARAERRVTRYRGTVVPAPDGSGADRLVPSPVFVISPIRSGSTLLRVLLNSHSQVRAPHEMHLRTLHVTRETGAAGPGAGAAGPGTDLDRAELEHLLWDRVMHRELQRSGKSVLVDKTPGNAAVWPRLAQAWPQARFVFLLRHPASIATSLAEAGPERGARSVQAEVLDYGTKVDAARRALPGLTVRYEDLTADPAGVTRSLCAFLQVPWEPDMLQYGRHSHGSLRAGIGDWSEKIKSGRVQPARPLPPARDVPPALRELTAAWGYSP